MKGGDLNKKIRIMVADDHAMVRDGIRNLVMGQNDLEVVGEAVDGRDLLQKAKKIKPDVVLLDLTMPQLNGLETIPLLKEALPGVGMIILSMHDKEAFVRQALAAGALGYVLKSDTSDALQEAIRKVAAGHYFISPALNAEVIRNYLNPKAEDSRETSGYDSLSRREQQVFRLVVQGHPTKEIAALLFLSPRTVEKHRASIISKLGLRDTSALVRYAVKIGVVSPELWS